MNRYGEGCNIMRQPLLQAVKPKRYGVVNMNLFTPQADALWTTGNNRLFLRP
jgi:hypothetical protein